MKMKKNLVLLLAILFLTSPASSQTETDHNLKINKNLEIFNSIYRKLDMMYVDSIDADKTINTAINSMLRSLDPYTIYYPEDDEKELKFMITGKYGGIGSIVRYSAKRKGVMIEEPYLNTPAAEAGLKKGDLILSINDTSMVGKTVSEVSDKLRGESGTSFKLVIERPTTKKKMTFNITRRAINQPAVPYYGMIDENIGYIRLISFTEGCAEKMKNAFLDLKDKGMKSLIFDLRSNGGGSEAEAAEIVNMFIPKDIVVVSNKGKMKRTNHDYKTNEEPLDTEIPVVLLVDDETASASEITSGALQDLDRGVVMGTKTFGKGLVQMTIGLPYDGTMKFTTSKYYIPSGRCIQAVDYRNRGAQKDSTKTANIFHTKNGRVVKDGGGIQPDIEIKPDTIPNIALYLSMSAVDSTDVMHEYIVDYVYRHKTIAPAREFSLTDEEYEEFKKRVIESGFTYDPQTKKVVTELEKLAKFEGYYDVAKQEFENLKEKLTHNIAKDLETNKKEILNILNNDIVRCYYYQAGGIENLLDHDKFIKEACELLKDKDRYEGILKPKAEENKGDAKEE